MIIKYCGSHKGKCYHIIESREDGYYQIEIDNIPQLEKYSYYETALIELLRLLED